MIPFSLFHYLCGVFLAVPSGLVSPSGNMTTYWGGRGPWCDTSLGLVPSLRDLGCRDRSDVRAGAVLRHTTS